MSIANSKTTANKQTRIDKARRLRDVALLLGLLGFVLVGLASLAVATGWEETMAQFRKLDLWQILVLLLLSLVNYLTRATRWRVFTCALGLGTGALQDSRHFLGGLAMAVTPGRVGELIRIRWIRRETGWAFERSAPIILVDRAADLAAMALILAVAIAFMTAGIAFAVPVATGALLISFLATRPSIMAALATGAYRTTGRFPRSMVSKLR